jgi:cytochrome c oxidase subunit 3
MVFEGTVKEAPATTGDAGAPPRVPEPGGDGGGGPAPSFGADPTRFGLWVFLGTVTMLFIGFTSAYVVRRSSGGWRAIAPPALLWLNTALLLGSSATVELARRRLRSWDLAGARRYLALTGVLGILFVAGQLGAWRALADQGVFLATSPHSSFFYLLTGLHVVHLLGGLAWFAVVLARLRRLTLTPGEDGLGLFATYWHFLGALWVYLFLLLFVF